MAAGGQPRRHRGVRSDRAGTGTLSAAKLTEDMGVATEKLRRSGVTLPCNMREKGEVAALYETALAADARGIREPHDIFRGWAYRLCGRH